MFRSACPPFLRLPKQLQPPALRFLSQKPGLALGSRTDHTFVRGQMLATNRAGRWLRLSLELPATKTGPAQLFQAGLRVRQRGVANQAVGRPIHCSRISFAFLSAMSAILSSYVLSSVWICSLP